MDDWTVSVCLNVCVIRSKDVTQVSFRVYVSKEVEGEEAGKGENKKRGCQSLHYFERNLHLRESILN